MNETNRAGEGGMKNADLHDIVQALSKAITNDDWKGALAHVGKVSAGITKRLNEKRKADRINTVYTVSGAIRAFGKVEEL